MGGAGGDAPITEALVVTSRNATPVAGIRVIVHDAAGLPIAESVTAMDGSAAFDVPDGGSFTAAWLEGFDNPVGTSQWEGHRLVTYHAIEQGATYELQLKTREPEEVQPERMRFTFNVTSLPAGASYLQSLPGCGVGGDDNFFGPVSPFVVDHVGCPGFDEAGMVVAAMSAAAPNGPAIGFYVLPPTTFQPGMDVTIDLSAASFAPPISSTAPYAIDLYSHASFGASVVLEDGQRFYGGAALAVQTTTKPQSGELVAFHPGNQELILFAGVNTPNGAGLRPRTELEWRGSPPGGVLIGADASIAAPYNVDVSVQPDLARPTLTCFVPSNPQGEAMWMSFRYYIPSMQGHEWEHYAPMSLVNEGGLLTLQTPSLPADLQGFAPSPEDTLTDVLCAVQTRTGESGPTKIARPLSPNELWRTERLQRELTD